MAFASATRASARPQDSIAVGPSGLCFGIRRVLLPTPGNLVTTDPPVRHRLMVRCRLRPRSGPCTTSVRLDRAGRRAQVGFVRLVIPVVPPGCRNPGNRGGLSAAIPHGPCGPAVGSPLPHAGTKGVWPPVPGTRKARSVRPVAAGFALGGWQGVGFAPRDHPLAAGR